MSTSSAHRTVVIVAHGAIHTWDQADTFLKIERLEKEQNIYLDLVTTITGFPGTILTYDSAKELAKFCSSIDDRSSEEIVRVFPPYEIPCVLFDEKGDCDIQAVRNPQQDTGLALTKLYSEKLVGITGINKYEADAILDNPENGKKMQQDIRTTFEAGLVPPDITLTTFAINSVPFDSVYLDFTLSPESTDDEDKIKDAIGIWELDNTADTYLFGEINARKIIPIIRDASFSQTIQHIIEKYLEAGIIDKKLRIVLFCCGVFENLYFYKKSHGLHALAFSNTDDTWTKKIDLEPEDKTVKLFVYDDGTIFTKLHEYFDTKAEDNEVTMAGGRKTRKRKQKRTRKHRTKRRR